MVNPDRVQRRRQGKQQCAKRCLFSWYNHPCHLQANAAMSLQLLPLSNHHKIDWLGPYLCPYKYIRIDTDLPKPYSYSLKFICNELTDRGTVIHKSIIISQWLPDRCCSWQSPPPASCHQPPPRSSWSATPPVGRSTTQPHGPTAKPSSLATA